MGPDSLLRQKVKQKRFREGYEAGLSTTHRAASALAFIMSDTPVEMLGQYSRCALQSPDWAASAHVKDGCACFIAMHTAQASDAWSAHASSVSKLQTWRESVQHGLHLAMALLAWHGRAESMHDGCRFELEGADSQAPLEGVENAVEAAAYVFLHPATHAEVRALAADLQVLGRSEFKQLLKWCVLVLQSLLTDFDWESWWLV